MDELTNMFGINQRYEDAKAEGKIDLGCIPFCDLLNRIGLFTRFCCEGHEGDILNSTNRFFRILFEDSMPEERILAFLEILNKTEDKEEDYFVVPTGQFYKYYRYIRNELAITWMFEIGIGNKEYKEKTMKRALEHFSRAEKIYRERVSQ
ncbi:hypothetical protein MASR2M70_12860 [Bacillota bacterium]